MAVPTIYKRVFVDFHLYLCFVAEIQKEGKVRTSTIIALRAHHNLNKYLKYNKGYKKALKTNRFSQTIHLN